MPAESSIASDANEVSIASGLQVSISRSRRARDPSSISMFIGRLGVASVSSCFSNTFASVVSVDIASISCVSNPSTNDCGIAACAFAE